MAYHANITMDEKTAHDITLMLISHRAGCNYWAIHCVNEETRESYAKDARESDRLIKIIKKKTWED